jgi:hypothetical protein
LMSCSAKPQPCDQGTARTKKIIKCDNALAAAVQCWTLRGPSREKPSGGGCARLHNLRRVAWGRGLQNATCATRWRGVGTGPARNWKIFERKLKSLSHGPDLDDDGFVMLAVVASRDVLQARPRQRPK